MATLSRGSAKEWGTSLLVLPPEGGAAISRAPLPLSPHCDMLRI